PAEAQHPDVHLAAAAHHRDVGGHVAVDESAAAVDERPLLVERQLLREVHGARDDLHGFTLPFAAMRPGSQEPRSAQRTQSTRALRPLRALGLVLTDAAA